jgi:hypothetical protein
MDNDLRHVKTMSDLHLEKDRIRQRLVMRQKELSHKMYEIPAELAAAGANHLIPGFLRGKVTNAALSGGKKLINAFLVPEQNVKSLLPKAAKGFSLVRGIRSAIKLFKR